MAYTPPLGSAINFDGTGAPYTPPPGNAINFDGGATGAQLVGQQASVQQGTLTASVTGSNVVVALSGQQVATQQNVLVASSPGSSYSVTLSGLELTVQQSMPGAVVAYLVPLTTQVMAVQRGGMVASTPTQTSVPLIGQALAAQRGSMTGKVSTGVIEWAFAAPNITLSGTPKLTATAFSDPYPYVYSTGGEDAYGGKRYFEVALSKPNQAFGISNQWHSMSSSKSLGMATAGGEDLYSWALHVLLNGTLQVQHNGTAIAQGAYTFVTNAPIMCALDFTAGLIWFGYNGTWVGGGDPTTGVNPTYTGVSGFPHPVLILGSMGSPIPNSMSQIAVLHATVNNQQFCPAGFIPWEDIEGASISVGLTGQAMTAQKGGFGVVIFADPDVSIMLLGISAQVRFNLMGIDRNRQKVTWNPNDKSPYVTLTDANMGVTMNDPPDEHTYSVRATLGRAINSGKYYYEIALAFLSTYEGGYSKGPGIGIARQYGSYEYAENTLWSGTIKNSWNAALGENRPRESWFNLAADPTYGDPDPVYGYSHVGDWLDVFVPGRVLQLAVDFNAGKIWFGFNGKWFNSSQGSDPATGVLPQYSNIKTVITTTAFPEYPIHWPDFKYGDPPNPSDIGHFSAASFNFAPPAGFAPWEEADPVDRVVYLTGQKLLVWGTPLWHMEGVQATVQRGHFSGIQAGADITVFLDGLEATVRQGVLRTSNTFSITGVSATGAVGNVTVTTGVISAATGLELTVQQGVLDGHISQDATVALTGLQLATQQGAFSVSAGNNTGLAGLVVNVAGGDLTPRISVELTGLAASARGGTLGVDLVLALGGSQCAVLPGVLGVRISPTLVGQTLSAVSGVFVPALDLRPVGASLQARSGAFAPQLSLTLSGLSLVTHGDALRIALAVPLTGLRATITYGHHDYLYDCNVFLTGVQAVGFAGVEPLETNVPKPKRDTWMWAKYEVEKLFVGDMPDDLYNDIEPKK